MLFFQSSDNQTILGKYGTILFIGIFFIVLLFVFHDKVYIWKEKTKMKLRDYLRTRIFQIEDDGEVHVEQSGIREIIWTLLDKLLSPSEAGLDKYYDFLMLSDDEEEEDDEEDDEEEEEGEPKGSP